MLGRIVKSAFATETLPSTSNPAKRPTKMTGEIGQRGGDPRILLSPWLIPAQGTTTTSPRIK